MGAWGPGLYSSDTAEDLKPLIATVLKLPLPLEECIALLRTEIGGEATGLEAATFALVLADRFEKAGIHHGPTRVAALEVIDTAADLAALEELGMTPADLKARARSNAGLRARLVDPRPAKPRRTMAGPQPFTLEPGEVWRVPLQDGNRVNPYMRPGAVPFVPDGWGMFRVLRAEHVLGFLACYAVAMIRWPEARPPGMADAAGRAPVPSAGIGTLSKQHRVRMGIERLGMAKADASGIETSPDRMDRYLRFKAIHDVSLANSLMALHPKAEDRL